MTSSHNNSAKTINYYTGEYDLDGINFFIENAAKPYPVISLTNDGILEGDGTAPPTREGVGPTPQSRTTYSTIFESLDRLVTSDEGDAVLGIEAGEGVRIQGGDTTDSAYVFASYSAQAYPDFYDRNPNFWSSFWLGNGFEADKTWDLYFGFGIASAGANFLGFHIKNNDGVPQIFARSEDGNSDTESVITGFSFPVEATIGLTELFIKVVSGQALFYINGTLVKTLTTTLPTGDLLAASPSGGIRFLGGAGAGNPDIFSPVLGFSYESLIS